MRALIAKNPRAIIELVDETATQFHLPNGGVVQGFASDWSNDDYALVPVTAFVAPAHKVATGSPAYGFDDQGNVVESYAVVDEPPPPPPSVTAHTMLGRLTPTEYTAIMRAANQELAAGNGQLAEWLDEARTASRVVLTDSDTVAAKAALVGAGLLTSDRADSVFAPEE